MMVVIGILKKFMSDLHEQYHCTSDLLRFVIFDQKSI